MYSKLHVCDVKTFETLCLAKVLFGKNFLYQKGLCEKTSRYFSLSITPLPCFAPLNFCVNLKKRIFCDMKSEKTPKNSLGHRYTY